MNITLPATTLAKGWLAVSQASGKAESQPALCKTVHIDQYPTGLRLVATDSYMILTCWVPSALDDLTAEPLLDEVPYASATAIDRHGRAGSLLGYLLTLARSDDHKGLEVTVNLNVPWQPEDTDPADLQMDGFEALAVTLEQPGRERLQLEVYEGSYPHWQTLVGRQRRARTEALALSPTIAGRLAKAAKAAEAETLKMWFGGREKPMQVEFGGDPVVTGLVMPVRWDFAKDAPYGTDDTEEAGE